MVFVAALTLIKNDNGKFTRLMMSKPLMANNKLKYELLHLFKL